MEIIIITMLKNNCDNIDNGAFGAIVLYCDY